MQYLLSVYMDDNQENPAPEDMTEIYKAVDVVNQEIKDKGAWVFAGGLFPVSSATTIRHRSGDLVTTDGPYAETKEQLGGFWVIEAADLDEALEWANKGAVACRSDIEVRPFQPEPEA